jgi:hypothetical protein
MNHHQRLRINPLAGIGRTNDPEKVETAEKLKDAIGASNDVLLRVQSVWPLMLFPSTITLDRAKITITERDFFSAGEILTIRVEDILNVTAQVGPFFGSVKITTRFFNPEKPYVVYKLHRSDALRLKRIVQGYLIAMQKKIDCSKLTTKELTRTLDELGKVGPEERV